MSKGVSRREHRSKRKRKHMCKHRGEHGSAQRDKQRSNHRSEQKSKQKRKQMNEQRRKHRNEQRNKQRSEQKSGQKRKQRNEHRRKHRSERRKRQRSEHSKKIGGKTMGQVGSEGNSLKQALHLPVLPGQNGLEWQELLRNIPFRSKTACRLVDVWKNKTKCSQPTSLNVYASGQQVQVNLV